MSKLITNGLRHLGASVDNLTLDNAGRVLMPNVPCFNVRGSGGNGSSLGAILPYDTIIHDNGNNYNASTRRFTAPVAGHYRLSCGGFTNQSAYLYASIHKNGAFVNGYATIGFKQGAGVEYESTASCVVYANAGDYFDVRVWFYSSGAIYLYGDHGSFAGELIG